MDAGYSGKPLVDKLGVKPGMRLYAVAAPAEYEAWLAPLPQGAEFSTWATVEELVDSLGSGNQIAFLHFFTTSRKELAAAAPILTATLAPGGSLWVSWPKLSAVKKLSLASDVTEQTLRDLLLSTGLVDVKVCAVSEVWSGLKFLWRKN